MTENGSRYTEVGARLANLRRALDLPTDAALAHRLGISPQKLSNYMRGTSRPDLETATLIVRSTGVTLDWIYFGDERGLTLHLAEKLRLMSQQGEALAKRSATPA